MNKCEFETINFILIAIKLRAQMKTIVETTDREIVLIILETFYNIISLARLLY